MKNRSLTLCPSLAITTTSTFYSKPDWLEKFLLHHCLMNVFLIHSSTHSNLVSIKNTTETTLRKPLKMKVKVTQSCPTLCNPMQSMGSLSLLQGIFPTLRIVWRDRRRARRVLLGRNISRRREQPTVSKARGILKIQTGRYCPCNLGVIRSLLGLPS